MRSGDCNLISDIRSTFEIKNMILQIWLTIEPFDKLMATVHAHHIPCDTSIFM